MKTALLELLAQRQTLHTGQWGDLKAAADIVTKELAVASDDEEVRFDVPRNGDLFSAAWYEAQADNHDGTSPRRASDAIEWLQYEIGGTVYERVTGTSLDALALFDPLARPTAFASALVVPLRLCTGGLERALPLIGMRFHEVTLRLKLRRPAGRKHLLHVEHLVLDDEVRRRIAQSPQLLPRLTAKRSLVSSHRVCSPATALPIEVPLDDVATTVRDLVVTIRPPPVRVERAALLVKSESGPTYDWTARQAWTSEAMVRGALPRHRYGIVAADGKDATVLFFTFDLAPLADEPSGGMNLRAMSAKLAILLEVGSDDREQNVRTFEVDVLVRGIRDINIQSGMAA